MEHQVTPNDLTDQSRSNICGTLRREKGRNGPKVCEKSKHKFYKKSSSQVKSGGVIRKSMTIKMENILPINLQRSHSLNPFLVSSKVKKTTFAGGEGGGADKREILLSNLKYKLPFMNQLKEMQQKLGIHAHRDLFSLSQYCVDSKPWLNASSVEVT